MLHFAASSSSLFFLPFSSNEKKTTRLDPAPRRIGKRETIFENLKVELISSDNWEQRFPLGKSFVHAYKIIRNTNLLKPSCKPSNLTESSFSFQNLLTFKYIYTHNFL